MLPSSVQKTRDLTFLNLIYDEFIFKVPTLSLNHFIFIIFIKVIKGIDIGTKYNLNILLYCSNCID